MRSVPSATAVSATYRSRSVPSSARKQTSAPSRSASASELDDAARPAAPARTTRPTGRPSVLSSMSLDDRWSADLETTGVDRMARRASRRSEGRVSSTAAGTSGPSTTAAATTSTGRAHSRRGAPALGHAARRSRSPRVACWLRPSASPPRCVPRASETTRSSSPTTTTTCRSPHGSGGRCARTTTTRSRCSTGASPVGPPRDVRCRPRSPTFAPVTFTARLRTDRYATKQDVLDALQSGSATLLDARMDKAYDTASGHIPGARRLTGLGFLRDGETLDGRVRTRQRASTSSGSIRTLPVIAYCGGGVAATGTALGFVLAGRPQPTGVRRLVDRVVRRSRHAEGCALMKAVH